MTLITNPIDDPEAYDHFFIGNSQSPGLCEFDGACLAYLWDKKRGKGAKGATTTFTGVDIADAIKVQLRFWLGAQFDAWDAFRQILKYDPTRKTVTALDIQYPALQRLDINSVQCTYIGQEKRIDKSGLWAVEIRFIQYAPPPPVASVATPTTSQTTSTDAERAAAQAGNATPSAADAQQQEIAKLLAKAQAP